MAWHINETTTIVDAAFTKNSQRLAAIAIKAQINKLHRIRITFFDIIPYMQIPVKATTRIVGIKSSFSIRFLCLGWLI